MVSVAKGASVPIEAQIPLTMSEGIWRKAWHARYGGDDAGSEPSQHDAFELSNS
jgi:hypothetical protein